MIAEHSHDQRPKIFVAAPFSNYLGADGVFDRNFRQELEQFYACLANAGFEYFSAQVNEDWGSSPLAPAECVPIDHKELVSSDAVVAVLGIPPSLGVVVELGWASALQKPILILGTAIDSSSMIAGLDRVTNVRFIDRDLGIDVSGADLGQLVVSHLVGD